jgi:hypothetical protein
MQTLERLKNGLCNKINVSKKFFANESSWFPTFRAETFA